MKSRRLVRGARLSPRSEGLSDRQGSRRGPTPTILRAYDLFSGLLGAVADKSSRLREGKDLHHRSARRRSSAAAARGLRAEQIAATTATPAAPAVRNSTTVRRQFRQSRRRGAETSAVSRARQGFLPPSHPAWWSHDASSSDEGRNRESDLCPFAANRTGQRQARQRSSSSAAAARGSSAAQIAATTAIPAAPAAIRSGTRSAVMPPIATHGTGESAQNLAQRLDAHWRRGIGLRRRREDRSDPEVVDRPGREIAAALRLGDVRDRPSDDEFWPGDGTRQLQREDPTDRGAPRRLPPPTQRRADRSRQSRPRACEDVAQSTAPRRRVHGSSRR